MNTRQLEAFRATMRSGSITGAATLLHISQPSVSRLISDLEDSIGFKLFVRIGRGLTPTVDGKTFYHAVEGMFMGMDRLEEFANSIKNSDEVEISIGTIQSIAAVELPRAVAKMHQSSNDVRFMIQSRNTPAILNSVQMHQLDLGVVGRSPPYEGVEVLYQKSVPYVCLVPENHWLADQVGLVDLNMLASTEEFVTFGGAFPESMMSIDPKLASTLRNGSRLSATNMPVSGALVREVNVLAICDPFSAEQTVMGGGVVFRPILQNLTYHVAIITPGQERLSRSAMRFVDILSTQIDQRVVELQKYLEAKST